MKNVSLILILNLFSSFVTFAQNYQTVISNRISYFDNQSETINCVRIDSAVFLTDSTLYPFSYIREMEDGCFTPYGASWIGEKIVKKENGLNIFLNRDHDSIQIKTKALLNDSWTVYYIPDSIKITATVIRHDTMSFLGQLDSVKSIGFQVYDKNMHLLDYPLNNMVLKISKDFGFVKTFNFYLFPKIGIQNLTWFGIYDFQPGDELHIVYEVKDWMGYLGSLKSIRKYIGRSDYNDSIIYTLSLKVSNYVSSRDTTYNTYLDTIVKEKIWSNPAMDKLPGEPVLEGDTSRIYFNTMENGEVITKTHASNDEIFFRNTEYCWELPTIVDDCLEEDKYLKGLGGPYYSCYDFTTDWGNKLVYYKKGDVSWGTPLVITSLPDRPDQENILVFPNPAHDHLTIRINKLDQAEIFEILDMTGRVVIRKHIVSVESNIGLEEVKTGSYVYRIRNDKEIVKMDKLIIK
jgi:hypothetical protein